LESNSGEPDNVSTFADCGDDFNLATIQIDVGGVEKSIRQRAEPRAMPNDKISMSELLHPIGLQASNLSALAHALGCRSVRPRSICDRCVQLASALLATRRYGRQLRPLTIETLLSQQRTVQAPSAAPSASITRWSCSQFSMNLE
jgi:hypothetical protein